MKVHEIFDVIRGTAAGADNYDSGPVPLVSACAINNGVSGFIATQAREKLFVEVPCLSVAVVGQGGTMFAAVQRQEFYATHHTEILIPNKDAFWSNEKEAKLVAAAAYLRKQRWRFHYMRPAGGRLAELDLDMATLLSIAQKIAESNAASQIAS